MAEPSDATTRMVPRESLPNSNGMDHSIIFNHRDITPIYPSQTENDQYARSVSPLPMPPGQIEGLDALKSNRHLQQRGQYLHRTPSPDNMLQLNIPGGPSPVDIAVSAIQYLPYPLMVLNGRKTLVMANEAMGRLLGIEEDDGDNLSNDGISEMEKLNGQSLSQLGIDMLQEGRPVWVSWDTFLDSLAEEIGSSAEDAVHQHASKSGEGDVTPTVERTEPDHARSKSMVHDAVVEVIITQAGSIASSLARPDKTKLSAEKHTTAKMIITIWEIDDDKFYTLTFTSTDSTQTQPIARGQSRQVLRASKYHSLGSTGSGSGSSPSSVASGQSQGGSSSSSAITSPKMATMSTSPFPPLGPPSRITSASMPSTLHKAIMMKDALLDNTQMPILAMWRDESLTVPNKAARRLFHPRADLQNIEGGFDLLTKWHVWDENFTTRLDPSEYPISVLVRTQTPFSSRILGLIDPENGCKLIFDCLGEAMRDEETGEFLAGIVTCRDITELTENMNEQINEIKEKDDQRFQLICDSMPQMIWTASPNGMPDWFSQRW